MARLKDWTTRGAISQTFLSEAELTTVGRHMERALRQVYVLEGGNVLHDHLSYDEYVARRGQFLAPLPAYMKISVFTLARVDAELVFESHCKPLSVEEVRRQEVRLQITPLLPLPTTENTDTIDNFASYPDSEWPGLAGVVSNAKLGSTAIVATSPRTSLHLANFPASTSPPRRTTASTAAMQSSPPRFSLSGPLNMRAANLADQAGAYQQTSAQYPDNSSPSLTRMSRTSSSFLDHTSTPFTSPPTEVAEPRSNRLSSSGMTRSSLDHELVLNIVDALGPEAASVRTGYHPSGSASRRDSAQDASTKPALSNNQPTLKNINQGPAFVSPGLTALAGHGIRGVPVKYATGATRPAYAAAAAEVSQSSKSSDQIDNVTDRLSSPQLGLDPAPPAKKKPTLKLRIPVMSTGPTETTQPPTGSTIMVRPKRKAPAEVDSDDLLSLPVSQPAAKKRKTDETKPETKKSTTTITTAKPATKKPAAKNKAAAPPRPTSHFELVIAGTDVARDRQEARRAATTRLRRLRTAHANTPDAGAKIDFMPEFFDKASFPSGEEEDQVRCVCGVVEDDSQILIICDSCSVWQHVECVEKMGGLVPPKGKRNDPKAKYSCQVCDPFAQKHLIAQLRQEAE